MTLVLMMGEGDVMGTGMGMGMGIGMGIRMHCMPLLDHVVHNCQSRFVRLPQGYKIGNVRAPFSKHNVQGIGK